MFEAQPPTSDLQELAAWRAAVGPARPGDLGPVLHTRPERPTGCSPREWANAMLDSVIARQRLIAHQAAQQVRDLVELSAAAAEDPAGVDEFLATELALALGVAESTAARYLLEATEMVTRCPATLDALEHGRISPGKASAICHGTHGLSTQITAAVEADVLPVAARSTIPGLRDLITRSVIHRDPEGARHRHEQARRRRYVSRRNEPDGMAYLSLYGTAQDIAAIWDCLTAAADATNGTDGDDRSIGERRVDALVDVCTDILDRGLLTDRPLPTTQRRRPHLLITIPATALLGEDEGEVAELVGHGPITPAQARVIAADATWRRLICDPITGTLLDYGRTTYTPPAALTDFVLTRDRTAPSGRFLLRSSLAPSSPPQSCRNRRQPAHRCDIDHREPFHPGQHTGGPTNPDNLATLCRHHHRAKDTGGYRLQRTDNGDHHWTTPLGRTYTREHTPLWNPPEKSARTAPLAGAGAGAGGRLRSGADDDPPPF